eukprot:TRINITY_DN32259_c0_g1_i3.p1 TRINITY_DN32259_c0_g1~~TRINITY_DN32259_c0_g1_i3.p1  ORF type:complete len:257 (-),score=-32.56 TRINITY_DN32259_c0_g1_i3:83-853(-)
MTLVSHSQDTQFQNQTIIKPKVKLKTKLSASTPYTTTGYITHKNIASSQQSKQLNSIHYNDNSDTQRGWEEYLIIFQGILVCMQIVKIHTYKSTKIYSLLVLASYSIEKLNFLPQNKFQLVLLPIIHLHIIMLYNLPYGVFIYYNILDSGKKIFLAMLTCYYINTGFSQQMFVNKCKVCKVQCQNLLHICSHVIAKSVRAHTKANKQKRKHTYLLKQYGNNTAIIHFKTLSMPTNIQYTTQGTTPFFLQASFFIHI